MIYLEMIVRILIERNDLVLKENVPVEHLIYEIEEKLRKKEAAVQVGEWLGRTLVQSEFVEELYASDKEIYSILKEF